MVLRGVVVVVVVTMMMTFHEIFEFFGKVGDRDRYSYGRRRQGHGVYNLIFHGKMEVSACRTEVSEVKQLFSL